MRAAARHIIDFELLEVPAYAVEDRELWTPKLVKDALVEAYEVYRDTIGRVGPRGNKAFWSEYYREWGDLIAQAEIGGNDVVRRHRRRSSLDIERADMVLLGWTDRDGRQHAPWLNGALLVHERPRKCLVAWLMCKHHGVTEDALCKRNKWPLATFRRHKDFAAGRIAHNLNQVGVEVW